MIVTPSGVFRRPRSARTRAVMPTDVAVRMAPMKSATGSPKPSAPPTKTVATTPSVKGRITPPGRNGRGGPGVAQELLQVRLQTRDEEQHHGGNLADDPKLPWHRREWVGPCIFVKFEERAQGPQVHAPQREGPDDDAGRQLSQDGGNLQVAFADLARGFGGEEDQGQLQDNAGDVLCEVFRFHWAPGLALVLAPIVPWS